MAPAWPTRCSSFECMELLAARNCLSVLAFSMWSHGQRPWLPCIAFRGVRPPSRSSILCLCICASAFETLSIHRPLGAGSDNQNKNRFQPVSSSRSTTTLPIDLQDLVQLGPIKGWLVVNYKLSRNPSIEHPCGCDNRAGTLRDPAAPCSL